MQTRQPSRRFSGRNIISYLLFATAAGLFVVVAVLYYQDKTKDEPKTPPPASNPGHADLKNVADALRAAGVKVDYARSGGARSDDLTPPGQGLTADGKPLYVFIYESPDERTTETADLSGDITLNGPSGAPLTDGPPHTAQGSNVLVVLLGGDSALADKVDKAIEGLP